MQSARIDRATLLAAAAVFIAVLAIGLRQLYGSQPAEDAFILFKYAENVAHGEGIVYYPGGPRTEGATDFLWLMLLAASVRAGADVAVAALFWNALGAALCTALLARELARARVSGGPRWLLLAVPLSVPLVAGAPAAYLGFSSLAYQALLLVALAVSAGSRSGALGAVPWVGLLLALFRPDGAFLAAGFSIAGLVRAWRAGRARAFIASTVAAALVGAGYFAARWWYFGLPLPLPLYVKSRGVVHGAVADAILRHAPALKGIGLQLMWLKSALGPVPLIAALAVLLALAPRETTPLWRRRAGAAALAGGLLLGALSFVFQMQNVHFRYQAPATLLLLVLVYTLALERTAAASEGTRGAIAAVPLLALVPALCAGVSAIVTSAGSRSYIDVLPPRLADVLAPGRTIALTDAGRLGYWARGPVIDVAGLNDSATALSPPSVEWLRSIDPEVVLLHPGGAVVGQGFDPPVGAPPFWELDPTRIERQLAPEWRAVYEHGLTHYPADINEATIAAVVMLRYLVVRADDYATLAVRYQGGYRHVFAFRRGLPEASAIRAALEEATSGRSYRSYAALKGFPLAAPADTDVDRVPY